ncbi:MAG TPA: thiol peroxidase [Burkholderiales bacterium]|nr:thiol peroxidase [Burkholderiales bacterium]
MKTSAILTCFIFSGLFGFGPVALAAGEEVQGIKVNTDSASSGEGNTVKLKGNEIPLSGQSLKVGDALPAAMVTAGNLAPVNIADIKGKVRIISVVPSVDTATCEAQTHQLSEKNKEIADRVELVTISMDLPFAQQRFAKEANIKNITFYSDYKGANFGKNNGLLMDPLRLLARAVIVTDKDNIVRYIQVVPEITELPDMAAAMEFARTLL